MSSETYDIIIVGGGTAGLVLAARLSESPNVNVLVIEAGADIKDDSRVNIPAMWSTLIKSDADWAFDTVPQVSTSHYRSFARYIKHDVLTFQEHLGGRNFPFPHGRALGGSSAINGLVFTPIPRSNVESWTKLGNTGWDWPSFSESLNRAFQITTRDSEAVKGQLSVSYPTESNTWQSIWEQTLDGLGFSTSGDLFTGRANGLIVNPESIDPKTARRSYSQSAYLEPVIGRSNLTILTNSVVDKILFDQSDPDQAVATGVRYTQGDHVKTVYARKEVILASGAINSPMILERSGIGSAQLLERLGIDIVVDNSYVGENLQNHVIVTVSSEVKDGMDTMDGLRRQDAVAVAASMEAYQKQSGPLTTGGTSHTAQLPFPYIETDEGKSTLGGILTHTLSAERSDGFEEALKEHVASLLSSPEEAAGCYITFPGWAGFNSDASLAPPPDADSNYFSIALLSTHPLSRGSTHIKSASDSSPGCVAIDPKYLSHPLDVEIFAQNLRFVDTLLRAEPLSSHLKVDGNHVPSEYGPERFSNLDNAKDYVRRHGIGANHFVGSCSMMPREIGGVVNSQLLVYGTKNLRVCDASIIPIIPRANPQATVYGVAEHGASIIKLRLGI